MSINYNDIRFEHALNWIQENIDNGESKKMLFDYKSGNIGELDLFLEFHKKFYQWDVATNEFLELIEREIKDHEERVKVEEVKGKAVIVSHGEDNGLSASKSKQSAWYKYQQVLKNAGFDRETIRNIGLDSEGILKKISRKNRGTDSIKGLVVGSVQSGKTTNMAALMSMAADSGWNVFIVLAGMIDNLREQTQDRLSQELNRTNGTVSWNVVEDPSVGGRARKTPQVMDFEHQQHLIVTLKNVKRLENLYKWMISDPNKARQMRVLIIDDEADQASINTSDLKAAEERKAINRWIVKLVNGETDEDTPFCAMNYVGYTATPYANVLSESAEESLYPRDFISLLSQSPNYMGPSQIFGVQGEDRYPGLNIVNTIDKIDSNEFQNIRLLHDGKSLGLPQAMKESVAYFIGASASLRKNEFGKPVSMLIHTSLRINHHDNVSNAITKWLKNKNEVMELVEKVWTEQQEKFSINQFKEGMPQYSIDLEKTRKPHKYEEIKDEIINILSTIAPVISPERGQYEYHDGVHVVIDNGKYNQLGEDDEYFRLQYPTEKSDLDKTPIFLLIGGATLSRGLTIEGLVSTYFARSSGQADTLMQMGRWFGYRIGYELYPRIWMSSIALDLFIFLADLDYTLRDEIKQHNVLGKTPKDVGLRIKTSPKGNAFRVTSASKSRGAIESDYDFTGASIQTTIFDNDDEKQKNNLVKMESFIDSLGKPKIIQQLGFNTVFWESVDSDKIDDFLLNFDFSPRFRMGNNIEAFIEWISQVTNKGLLKDWNVSVVGRGEINAKDNNWHQKYFSWNKIERSKKKDERVEDIRIQSLRAPSDLYRDIDITKVGDENLLKMIKGGETKNNLYVRKKLGLQLTPQLILYRIDKDSKSSEKSETREDLNLKQDLVGIYITVPGGTRGADYVTHLVIKLDDKIILENDINGAN